MLLYEELYLGTMASSDLLMTLFKMSIMDPVVMRRTSWRSNVKCLELTPLYPMAPIGESSKYAGCWNPSACHEKLNMTLQCLCFSGHQHGHVPRKVFLGPSLMARTYNSHDCLEYSTKTVRVVGCLVRHWETNGWGLGGSGGRICNTHEYCC